MVQMDFRRFRGCMSDIKGFQIFVKDLKDSTQPLKRFSLESSWNLKNYQIQGWNI